MRTLWTILAVLSFSFSNAQLFNWEEIETGISTNINDIHFINEQTGWAAGNNGVILFTEDGGNSWATIFTGTTETIHAIYFVDDQLGFACGGDFGPIVMKTIDGGIEWFNITPSELEDKAAVDIAFSTPELGWFITRNAIFMSEDGGTSWTKEDIPTCTGGVLGSAGHHALAVVDDSIAHIASRGDNSPIKAEVYNRDPADNNNWKPSEINAFTNQDEQMISIDFPIRDVGYAGGNDGSIYRFENLIAGNYRGPWELVYELEDNNTVSSEINAMDFINEAEGSFISHNYNNDRFSGLIFHTSSSGQIWSTPDTLYNLYPTTLQYASDNVVYAAGMLGVMYKGVRIESQSTGFSAELDEREKVMIFPNPCQDQLNIVSNSNKTLNLACFNQQGQQIDAILLNQNSNLDISNWESGIYYIHVNDGSGVVQQLKFSKL